MLPHINPDGDVWLEEQWISILRTGHLHKQYYGNSRDLTVYDQEGNVVKTS